MFNVSGVTQENPSDRSKRRRYCGAFVNFTCSLFSARLYLTYYTSCAYTYLAQCKSSAQSHVVPTARGRSYPLYLLTLDGTRASDRY